jgi:hypothetical protein
VTALLTAVVPLSSGPPVEMMCLSTSSTVVFLTSASEESVWGSVGKKDQIRECEREREEERECVEEGEWEGD